MASKRQIFGVGGNFFVKAWQEPLLQRHLLTLTDAVTPKICLLAGANGDNPSDIELFYRQINMHDCRPYHLNLASPITRDFEALFLSMDIIYVFGGATKNLLSVWRDWGVDTALRAAWEKGVVLSGTSAGSICWFESCITDSFPPTLLPLRGLGLLKGSASTHYDSRPDRPSTFCELIANGVLDSPGLASDDDTAIHYIDDKLHEVVTARRGATAYTVVRAANGFTQVPLPARYLGAD